MNVQDEIRRIYEVLRDLQDRVMDLEGGDGEPDELTPACGFQLDPDGEDFDSDDSEY